MSWLTVFGIWIRASGFGRDSVYCLGTGSRSVEMFDAHPHEGWFQRWVEISLSIGDQLSPGKLLGSSLEASCQVVERANRVCGHTSHDCTGRHVASYH